jgi:anti-anti-sigma factor
MELVADLQGDVTVVKIQGNLDTQTSPDAQAELERLVNDGARKVLFDFADLAYISSAGLRVLLATAKKLTSSQGEMRICNMNDVVKDVFDISGFSTIFNVFTTDGEALEGF